MFVTPKFCISIVCSFSRELKWLQEKLKTMLMQNLGWQTKSIMVCYDIFWSGQLSFRLIKYTMFNNLCFNPSSVLSKCGFWIIYLQTCICSLIVLFFLFLFKEATIHNLPISHDNPPCFTKNLEKPLFLIPLGIIVAPREIQNSASASFFVCLFVFFWGGEGGLLREMWKWGVWDKV